MSRIILVSLFTISILCLSCKDDSKNAASDVESLRSNIGKCYKNKTSGSLVGEIIGIEKNPATGIVGYKVRDWENSNSEYYMSFDNCELVECASSIAIESDAKRLLGKCAYNPSDNRYLGRVIRIGPEGYDSAKRPRAGQRSVTIMMQDGQTTDVTYPKNLILRDCKEK